MTDFAGNIVFGTRYSDGPTNVAFGHRGWDVTLAEVRFYTLFGDDSNAQPITELGLDHEGNQVPYFEFLLFYNRIWVTPLNINLGNLISEQVRNISVFNAYFVDHTLTSITAEDDSGLTLTQPVALPAVFAPLQERLYTLNASATGAPDVDATYTFTFDSITIAVEVVATRVVAWTWEPNWETPPKERLECLTDVMPSFNGHEQRRGLRDGPRQFWEFAFNIRGEDRQRFETVYYGWGARPWALPQWKDGALLGTDVPAGATAIATPTAGRDYREGGIGLLIGGFGEIYESFEITGLSDTGFTLARATVNDWGAATRVYPARTARLLAPRLLSRLTRSYVTGTASFRSTEQIPGIAATEDLYRGFGVMEQPPNWRESPTLQYDRRIQEIDNQTGNVVYDDESGFPELVASWQWTALDRPECDAIRAWFYARLGRFKSFWLPSWAADLTLADTLASGDLEITVARVGLLQFINEGAGRRDIRIRLTDGTVYYRRVSRFLNVDAFTDKMSMNAPTGRTIEPQEIDMISWMSLARSDSDSLEIDWQNWTVAEAAIITRSVNNDF